MPRSHAQGSVAAMYDKPPQKFSRSSDGLSGHVQTPVPTLRPERGTSQSTSLLLLFASLHGRFRGLKTDSRVGTVTEGFIHRPAATAERERGFACEVVRITVAVDQLDGRGIVPICFCLGVTSERSRRDQQPFLSLAVKPEGRQGAFGSTAHSHYQLGNWIVMTSRPRHLQLRGYLPCP